MFSAALRTALGSDLSKTRALDVGCGSGGFLRLLVEWGARPANLLGTEFLDDRLQQAAEISQEGIAWRLGGLDFDEREGFDLVSAHTVFSSILNEGPRRDWLLQCGKRSGPVAG